MVQKVESRLSKWKIDTLSVGGRRILLKSVIGSIPNFYMSMFKVLSGILVKLEALRNAFFSTHREI